MRRLVVISGKSKLIATFIAMAFSLTSIHLAAKAHIASLQREQAAAPALSNQHLAKAHRRSGRSHRSRLIHSRKNNLRESVCETRAENCRQRQHR